MKTINHFVVKRKAIPDEILIWDWENVSLHPYENLPSVPCVLIVYKKDFDNLDPLQIGMTNNLKNYAYSDLDMPAQNGGTNVYYVIEESETKRKLMRQQLRSFFYDE